MKFAVLNVFAISMCLMIAGCGPKIKTQRMSTSAGDKKAMEVTDNWVMTDTTTAIQEVLKQMQNHKGYQRYITNMNGKTPKLFIAEIQNNTSEAYFPIQDMNDELLNELSASGEFILIDEVARNRILKEIKYQNDGMVDPKDVKSIQVLKS